MRALYTGLLYLALPLVFLYFLWRGLREPGYLKGWGERLGLGRRPPPGGIWLHAASVGEVAAAVPLLRALRERDPDSPLVVTTFTPTGRDRARSALGGTAHVVYLPLDLPGAVRRFLQHAQPRLAILLEAELWPNLLHGCRAAGVPVLLANARLSEASAARYRRGVQGRLIGDALRGIDCIAAVSDEDAERFTALGVPAERVAVTGNLKFDLELPAGVEERGAALRRDWGAAERPVWIAASTHAGEEEIVLSAFAELVRRHPDLLLVLVPRHPQRFDGVAELCRRSGFACARRSRDEPVTAGTQILLGDTLGELVLFYATADLALVGGSLVSGIGGHNLLEPAALRLPVVTGEHLGAWETVADWLREAGALCRVADAAALASAVDECLEDHHGRKMAGLGAARVVEDHGGALARTLRLVPGLLTAA